MDIPTAELPGVPLRTSDELGLPSAAKEAYAFAVLGFLTAHGLPGPPAAGQGPERPVSEKRREGAVESVRHLLLARPGATGSTTVHMANGTCARAAGRALVLGQRKTTGASRECVAKLPHLSPSRQTTDPSLTGTTAAHDSESRARTDHPRRRGAWLIRLVFGSSEVRVGEIQVGEVRALIRLRAVVGAGEARAGIAEVRHGPAADAGLALRHDARRSGVHLRVIAPVPR
jgi:hypothetical protein